MGRLGVRAVAGALLGLAVVLCVGVAAGTVRLLPWLLAPEVPVEVSLPFARALGAAATESALLVGAPLGVALVISGFVERGEARALMALGVSPERLTASLAPALLGFGALALASSLAWGSSADVPGRFARELVEQGRASCARASLPRSAEVPLVGVTWLCFPGQPPRVSGALPGLRGVAWFTARDFVPSDDLREVSLSELRVFTKKLDDKYELEMNAGAATVRGLPGWGRSAKLALPVRALLAAGTAVVLALGAAFSILLMGATRRIDALVIAGLPAFSAFALQSRLDASSLPAGAYAAVPFAALLVLAIVTGARGALARRR